MLVHFLHPSPTIRSLFRHQRQHCFKRRKPVPCSYRFIALLWPGCDLWSITAFSRTWNDIICAAVFDDHQAPFVFTTYAWRVWNLFDKFWHCHGYILAEDMTSLSSFLPDLFSGSKWLTNIVMDTGQSRILTSWLRCLSNRTATCASSTMSKSW